MNPELGQVAYIPDTDWSSRHISTLKKRAVMILETLVFSPCNQLTRLVNREYFIIQSQRESYKSDTRLAFNMNQYGVF
jgi:hypothetical protein